MAGTSKFWKGVLYGAIAGGAVTLLDKQTRQSVTESCRKAGNNISYMIKHPDEVTEQVKDVTGKIRSTIHNVTEEFNYVTSKIEEIREMAPQVAEIVKETKDAFILPDKTPNESGGNVIEYPNGKTTEQSNGRALDHQMETESLYGKRNLQ